MFTSILAGTDGSASSLVAVARASQLASRLGAKLSLLSVKDTVEEAERTLENARADAGMAFEPRYATGDPVDGILAAAGDVDADLVVVGNRGMQGRSRFLGSVPNSVSHSLRSSLLIVATAGHEGAPEPYRDVVVGTDGSDGSAKAIHAAATVAKAFDAHLRVVHAYRAPSQVGEVLAAAGYVASGVPSAAASAPAEEAARDVIGAARGVVREYAVRSSFDAVDGYAADVLVESSRPGDLLVTGSRGMTGVARLLGSVPNNISHHAPCDVLIVHTT